MDEQEELDSSIFITLILNVHREEEQKEWLKEEKWVAKAFKIYLEEKGLIQGGNENE